MKIKSIKPQNHYDFLSAKAKIRRFLSQSVVDCVKCPSRWQGGSVVSTLASQLKGPGFDSRTVKFYVLSTCAFRFRSGMTTIWLHSTIFPRCIQSQHTGMFGILVNLSSSFKLPDQLHYKTSEFVFLYTLIILLLQHLLHPTTLAAPDTTFSSHAQYS